MKEKRRSNEKRKEKSRDAARCRRSRETDIFTELAAALPVPPADAAHLDKASVMRLAIAYLKTRTLMDAVPEPLAKPEVSSDLDELFLKGLDGFVLVLDNNGDMVYLSPNVKDYLGIAQMDLMGQSVFDYSHPCDHDEIRESFSLKASEISEDHPCNFFLRLKCTLTSKGRKVNLKSASYKVIHCTGRLFAHPMTRFGNNNGSDSEGQEENVEKEPGVSLVVVASPVPHPSNIEIPLGKYTFLSKHNLNMKFTYADDKLAEFLGWGSSELVGQSVFDYHHALDNLSLDKSFKSLFSKGQCETMAYRFLNKSGGYAWVVTQATLIHCSRLQKPLSVVCVNYLLSGVECADEVYSVRQLEARTSQLKQEASLAEEQPQPRPVAAARPPPLAPRKPLAEKPVAVTASFARFHELQPKPEAADDDSESPLSGSPARPRCILDKENEQFRPNVDLPAGFFDQEANPTIPICEVTPEQQQQEEEQDPSLDKFATASIFSNRTNDMNKDFIKFAKNKQDIIMIRDESENLSYLAPTFGEECVTLENAPLSEIFNESIFTSEYSLLSPRLPCTPTSNDTVVCSASLNSSGFNPFKEVGQTILEVDPLKTDDCSSDGDPFIYRDSPSRCSLGTDLHSPTLTKSPEGSGIGDSLSSLNGSGGGLSEDEMLMLSIGDLMADDDMSPLKVSYIPMSDQDEALQLLISDDLVMWGASQSNDKKNLWLTDAGEESANSSLAQLLTNETSSNKLMKEHGGTLVNPTHVLGQISLKHATKDITAERERPSKRAHSSSSRSNHEIKRVKHDSESNSCGNTSSNNFSSLENILSASVQNSQLLQQLVSQQVPKNRTSWSDQLSSDFKANKRNGDLAEECCRGSDDGGAGLDAMLRNTVFEEDAACKAATQQRPQQQSNSVLMNLLVSGCDMQGLQNQVPMSGLLMRDLMFQQKKEQLQTVPQSYNPTLCCSDLPLSGNLPYGSLMKLGQSPQYQQSQQHFFEPISFDDLDLTMSVIQEDQDEFLRALDPNLV